MYTDEQLKKILVLFGDNGCSENLEWNVHKGKITFYINCSDFFEWATADLETIEPEDIDLLEKARIDCLALDEDGDRYFHDVFICRKRNMRPQGAAYKYYPKYIQELFNQAGPKRQIDIFNSKENINA